MERTIHPILMDDRAADSLLVVEVLTPAGHWSSYPPHKHDRDDPPKRDATSRRPTTTASRPGAGLRAPARLHRRPLARRDAVAFGDRDCVLVPRGYHTVSAPPGYDVYYLNVMAGPAAAGPSPTTPTTNGRCACTAPTATRLLDNYVGGALDAGPGATEVLDVTNPATGEVLARVPLSGAADLDAAVAPRARRCRPGARCASPAPASCSRCASGSWRARRTWPAP